MFHFFSESGLLWMARIFISFGLLAVALAAAAGLGIGAGPAGRIRPGEFDFYVLSLSWSPSFCEEASERGNEAALQAPSAAGGRFPSWSMACGRNTSMASPNIASGPRRGSTATS